MQKVYKYELSASDVNAIDLPVGALPLSVDVQYGNPCMWVLVNPEENETETRFFRVAGTGHPIKSKIDKFIGTFLLENGSLVFHVFEVTG